MYLRHYGLRSKPFALAHDPAFYYPAAHQIPLNELCYSLEERHGLATLVGAPGTGKTTLLRRLLASFASHQRGVFLTDTALEGESLLRKLSHSFGVTTPAAQQAPGETIHRILLREARSSHVVVLLIDEAQSLSPHQFEEIRYLTNLESAGHKLIEIILAGQPSLDRRLAAPELAALRQRVAVRSRLQPLDAEHTAAYIEHRLMVSGSVDGRVFDPDAVSAVCEHSGGIPRLVNIICERCLLVGYVDDRKTIDRSIVDEAVSDLQLEPWESDVAAAAGAAPSSAVSEVEENFGQLLSRLAILDEKLDLLVLGLVRTGLLDPDSARSEPLRHWLEALSASLTASEDADNVSGREARASELPGAKKLPRAGTQRSGPGR